jgi:hypothetical protein
MKHTCALLHGIVTSINLQAQEDYVWPIEDVVQAPCDQLAICLLPVRSTIRCLTLYKAKNNAYQIS